jgi:hypothetical protein
MFWSVVTVSVHIISIVSWLHQVTSQFSSHWMNPLNANEISHWLLAFHLFLSFIVHITRMFLETHSLSWVYHGFIMGLSWVYPVSSWFIIIFHHKLGQNWEDAQKVQRQWRSSCSHEATSGSPGVQRGSQIQPDSALGMFNKNRWTSPTIYK